MPRIVVVGHPMIRFGIAAMLDRVPDIEVVAHGDTPGVVPQDLVDVIVIASHVVRDRPTWRVAHEIAGGIPVLIVSDPGLHDRSLIDPRTSVFGCVAVNVSCDELAAAVRVVAGRHCYVSVASARAPAGRASGLDVGALSPRERQTLTLIAQGYTHDQVARRMSVTKSTVETYVERIRQKLRVGNKAELTLAAMSLQLGSGTGGHPSEPRSRTG